MLVNVTMELEVEMDGLEYETEKGYESAMELFEESLEKAIKNNIERSWGFSDWPVKDILRIYVFASSEEEILGPEGRELREELESLRTRASAGLDDADQERLNELEDKIGD